MKRLAAILALSALASTASAQSAKQYDPAQGWVAGARRISGYRLGIEPKFEVTPWPGKASVHPGTVLAFRIASGYSGELRYQGGGTSLAGPYAIFTLDCFDRMQTWQLPPGTGTFALSCSSFRDQGTLVELTVNNVGQEGVADISIHLKKQVEKE